MHFFFDKSSDRVFPVCYFMYAFPQRNRTAMKNMKKNNAIYPVVDCR